MTENQKEVEFSEKELTKKEIEFIEKFSKSEGLTEEQKKVLEEALKISNQPRNMDKAII